MGEGEVGEARRLEEENLSFLTDVEGGKRLPRLWGALGAGDLCIVGW